MEIYTTVLTEFSSQTLLKGCSQFKKHFVWISNKNHKEFFNSKQTGDKPVPPLSAWQAFYLSVVSKNEHFFTDKLFACQSLLKLSTDKQKACHCNPRVLLTSFFLLSGVGKLHWQAFCLSTIHKNINWQAKCLSGLPKSKENSCTDKKNTCHKSNWTEVRGWGFLLLTSILLVSDIEK